MPSSGCSIQPLRLCTWVVMVNSSSFSGKRMPLRSTTRPIDIRPTTGGVIISPLIMGFSIHKCKDPVCLVWRTGSMRWGISWLVNCLLGFAQRSVLGMEQKTARARFGAQVGLGDFGVFFLQQSCMEDLAVLAALPGHCSTCKPGKAGILLQAERAMVEKATTRESFFMDF